VQRTHHRELVSAVKGAAVKRFALAAAVAMVMLLVGLVPAQPAQAATSTRTVRYGPFTIPAATDMGPGMIHNKLIFGVARPCTDCYVTSFTPDLVYPDGTRATMATGAMLHHMVLTSQWRRDATCGSSWLGLAGERFFASGNERTSIKFPTGYGYRVRYYDSWNLLVDLMNHATTSSQTVYVQVTFTIRPWWEPVQRLKPVWLDIDQCGDSEYSIPAGFSDTHWDWTVNVPGKVVAMIGHLHGYGVAIEATNESEGGTPICKSVATLDPMDPSMVQSMSTCTGDPLAVLKSGQVVRLHSQYDSPHPADDVMAIMLGYVNPS
jgi:hypothetical protein